MAGLRRLLLVALVCLLGASFSYGQEVRASITGIVTDPSGASVVGALITVTNVSQNISVTTRSNEAGNFATPFLAPGTYRLTVESSGFKKFIRENIVLQAQDKARIDVPLQVGALADSVTVSESVSMLETETASRSQIISNELIANVPTQGRNPFQIAWAAPGVIKSGSWRYLRSLDIGGTSGISINGGKEKENEVLLDGISDVQAGRTVMSVPTMDSVQEFKVLTNTYDAQYGRTGGGIITIVTKSGGNEFHGALWEYLQADNLNANQWELNKGGIKRPNMAINTFGAQTSGPIYVPKVFNGKNRLFWLLSYEGLRHRTADPDIKTFPLMEWRNGDFSTLYNAQGQKVIIYDPISTKADGTRTPFADNKIPAARLNKVAIEALKYYPAPKTAGDGPAHTNNYPYPSIWWAGMDQWVGRVDFLITPKNNFFFRYGQNPFHEFRSIVFGVDNPAEPSGNAPLKRNARTWTMDWTSTLSPRMTFDLRAGLNRWEAAGGNVFGQGFDCRKLGFDDALTSQFVRAQFPSISLGIYQGMGSRPPDYSNYDVYSVQPNLNTVVGRHFLKFGYEQRRYNDILPSPGQATGSYSFTKNWTQANASRGDTTSGNELATFLLGYPSSAYIDKNVEPAYRHGYYALFFNDDWKIKPRLTLNLGLRWDYEAPNMEWHDRMLRGLDFNAASPIAAQVKGLTLKGAVLFAGQGGQPRGAFEPDKNNFQPRIGASYRLRDKWVLRGGYGLYYLGQNEWGSTNGFSRRSNAVVTVDNLTPAVTLNNPFALLPGGRLLAPIGSSLGAASFLGESLGVNWLNRPLPYSHQYSFNIQRELPGDMLVEAAYVGNLSRKLPLGATPNFIPVNELSRRTAAGVIDTAYYTGQVPNPMAGLLPNNAAWNGATIVRTQLMYPYPQYSLSIANLPIGKQRYDGMQSKVSKRFSRGLTFLSSYTIGKTLEQVSLRNAQDFVFAKPEDTPLDKRPANQIDAPQKFTVAGVYELPFGRGRHFARNVPKALDYAIGGWALNFDIIYMSGWAINYPNAKQVKPGSAKVESGGTLLSWFKTSLWDDPSTGKRINPQEAYTLRDFPTRFGDVRVPSYQNWDASVSKYFPVHERMKLQFRAEFINAFNHPWFSDIASVNVTEATFGQLVLQQRNLPRFIKLALNLQW